MDMNKSKIVAVEKAKRLEALNALREKNKLTPEELEACYQDASSVKEVNTTVRVSSCCVTLGKLDDLSTTDMTEAERDFAKKCANSTRLEMFPVAQKKIASIVSKVARKREKCSLSGSYLMNEGTFTNEFLPYLKKREEELEEVKESILNNFDDRFEIFERETLSIVKKNCPDKLASVKAQLNFLQKRGAAGYTSKIGIEMRTGFDGGKIKKNELKEFLDRMKKNASEKFAGDVLYSFFDDLWDACITYAGKVTEVEDLSGYSSTRNTLANECIKVRGNALPIQDKIPDIIELSKKVEKVALCIDGLEAPDLIYDALVDIYVLARVSYGYLLEIPERTKSRAIPPNWLKQEEIVASAEEIIRLTAAS